MALCTVGGNFEITAFGIVVSAPIVVGVNKGLEEFQGARGPTVMRVFALFGRIVICRMYKTRLSSVGLSDLA